MNDTLKLDEFYKAQYEHEANRRHQISGQIATPIAVATVVSGAVYAMAKAVTIPLNLWEGLTLGGIAAALVAAAFFVYYVVRFQLGYKYHYLPTAAKLADYHQKLRRFHVSTGSSEDLAKAEYESFVQGELVGCAHENALKNDAKSGYLYRAHTALGAYVALAFIASIPSVVGSVVEGPPSAQVQRVEVVDHD